MGIPAHTVIANFYLKCLINKLWHLSHCNSRISWMIPFSIKLISKHHYQTPLTPQQSSIDGDIKKVNTVRECFFFIYLKCKVSPKDLCLFYVTCIRPLIHYGIVSFCNSLPQYLRAENNGRSPDNVRPDQEFDGSNFLFAGHVDRSHSTITSK